MSQPLFPCPVIILLGSNEGNRSDYLEKAKELIHKEVGKIVVQSSVYETAAWGKEDQPDFLNQVIKIETILSPPLVLDRLLNIEKALGRSRSVKWDKRTIDLDLLFYGNKVINEKKLVVPHPRISERKFTLMPLAEIMPGFIHPVLSKSILELETLCRDTLEVRIIPGSAIPDLLL